MEESTTRPREDSDVDTREFKMQLIRLDDGIC